MAYYGEQRRDYQNALRARWKERVIPLLGGACCLCGTTRNLEFHHKNPREKAFNISQIWSHKWERQEAELSKCELRCSDCHKLAHQAAHGKLFWRRGCRCDICTAARNVERKTDREMKAAKRKLDPSYGRPKRGIG